MSEIYHIGNIDILKLQKTAFLSSRNIAAQAVLACYDWATEQRKAEQCIISGFHSQLEKDVLHFLLKAKQPVILVLGRALYKELPEELKKPLEDGQLLIISPVPQYLPRQSVKGSMLRNKYIIENADEIVFGSLDRNGMLYPLYLEAVENGKRIKVIDMAKIK